MDLKGKGGASDHATSEKQKKHTPEQLQAQEQQWIGELIQASDAIRRREEGRREEGRREEKDETATVDNYRSAHFLLGGDLGVTTKIGPQHFRNNAPGLRGDTAEEKFLNPRRWEACLEHILL